MIIIMLMTSCQWFAYLLVVVDNLATIRSVSILVTTMSIRIIMIVKKMIMIVSHDYKSYDDHMQAFRWFKRGCFMRSEWPQVFFTFYWPSTSQKRKAFSNSSLTKYTHSAQCVFWWLEARENILERVFDPRPVVTPNPTQPNIAFETSGCHNFLYYFQKIIFL